MPKSPDLKSSDLKSPDEVRAQSIPISQGRRKPAAASEEMPAAADAAPQERPAPSTATASEAAQSDPAANEPRPRSGERTHTQHGPEYDSRGRKPADDRPNAFNAAAWLLEGATGLLEEARHSDLGLSEEFWQHFYAARRESLLTARALIDSLLAQTEQEAKQRKDKETRKQRRGSIAIAPSSDAPSGPSSAT